MTARWCFTSRGVSFKWKNPDLLFKNPDFLFRDPDFLLKNVDFIIKHSALRVLHERRGANPPTFPSHCDGIFYHLCSRPASFPCTFGSPADVLHFYLVFPLLFVISAHPRLTNGANSEQIFCMPILFSLEASLVATRVQCFTEAIGKVR